MGFTTREQSTVLFVGETGIPAHCADVNAVPTPSVSSVAVATTLKHPLTGYGFAVGPVSVAAGALQVNVTVRGVPITAVN
jgi:hypothetical protein